MQNHNKKISIKNMFQNYGKRVSYAPLKRELKFLEYRTNLVKNIFTSVKIKKNIENVYYASQDL